MTTKHTALYVRVSTEAQAEEGYSLQAQTERLTAFCKMKAIACYEPYIDGGFTGSNLDRPAMTRLIENAHAGLLERVVVYKLDRLSRSQKDTLFLIEDVFLPHGVEFVSINENIDTGTPYGRAMVGILSAFAQLERENIFLRTRMGMTERVKNGCWPGGGKPPFGYDYNREQGILIPNADSAKVSEIFRLYRDGWSAGRLAALYGFPHDNQVTQLLGHAVYTGMLPYKGKLYPGRHTPLVSAELFDEVQRQREARARKPMPQGEYLLSGLLVCGCCGAKMRYQKWGKAGAKLVCYSRDRSKPHLRHDPACPNRGIMADVVEQAVCHDLGQLSVELPEEKTEAPDVLPERALSRQKRRLERLYALYAEQEDDTLRDVIDRTRAEVERLEKALTQAEAHREKSKLEQQTAERLRTVSADWQSMTPAERRQLVRSCIERIVLTEDSMELHYTLTPVFPHTSPCQ